MELLCPEQSVFFFLVCYKRLEGHTANYDGEKAFCLVTVSNTIELTIFIK